MSTAAEQAPAYADAEPVRVLVADDQKVVRDGLSLLLGMLPGVEVIGTAVDGTDAVRQAEAALPNVVLMDLIMPNCDGVEATRLIARQQPDVQVVVLTAFSDDDSVFAALRAGPAATSPRTPAPARSCRRYRRCAQETPSWIRRCSAGWWRPSSAASPWAAPASRRSRRPAGRADQREIEVLTEIGAGLSNAEIAGKLCISGATVKSHINHLLARDRVARPRPAGRLRVPARPGGLITATIRPRAAVHSARPLLSRLGCPVHLDLVGALVHGHYFGAYLRHLGLAEVPDRGQREDSWESPPRAATWIEPGRRRVGA